MKKKLPLLLSLFMFVPAVSAASTVDLPDTIKESEYVEFQGDIKYQWTKIQKVDLEKVYNSFITIKTNTDLRNNEQKNQDDLNNERDTKNSERTTLNNENQTKNNTIADNSRLISSKETQISNNTNSINNLKNDIDNLDNQINDITINYLTPAQNNLQRVENQRVSEQERINDEIDQLDPLYRNNRNDTESLLSANNVFKNRSIDKAIAKYENMHGAHNIINVDQSTTNLTVLTNINGSDNVNYIDKICFELRFNSSNREVFCYSDNNIVFDYAASINRRNSTIRPHLDRYNESVERLRMLDNDKTNINNKISRYNNDIRQREQAKIAPQQELENLTTQNTNLTDEINTLRTQNETLAAEVSANEPKIQELTEEIIVLDSKIEKSADALNAYDKLIEKARTELNNEVYKNEFNERNWTTLVTTISAPHVEGDYILWILNDEGKVSYKEYKVAYDNDSEGFKALGTSDTNYAEPEKILETIEDYGKSTQPEKDTSTTENPNTGSLLPYGFAGLAIVGVIITLVKKRKFVRI